MHRWRIRGEVGEAGVVVELVIEEGGRGLGMVLDQDGCSHRGVMNRKGGQVCRLRLWQSIDKPRRWREKLES